MEVNRTEKRQERCKVNVVGSFYPVLQNWGTVQETHCKLFIASCWSCYNLCVCLCGCEKARESASVSRKWGNVHQELFSCWSIMGRAGSQPYAHNTHTHFLFLCYCVAQDWEKIWHKNWFKWSWLLSLLRKIIWWWKGRRGMLGGKKKIRASSWDITVCEVQRDDGGGGGGGSISSSGGECEQTGQWWNYIIRAVLPPLFCALSVTWSCTTVALKPVTLLHFVAACY